jgi:hypothetical protein
MPELDSYNSHYIRWFRELSMQDPAEGTAPKGSHSGFEISGIGGGGRLERSGKAFVIEESVEAAWFGASPWSGAGSASSFAITQSQ